MRKKQQLFNAEQRFYDEYWHFLNLTQKEPEKLSVDIKITEDQKIFLITVGTKDEFKNERLGGSVIGRARKYRESFREVMQDTVNDLCTDEINELDELISESSDQDERSEYIQCKRSVIAFSRSVEAQVSKHRQGTYITIMNEALSLIFSKMIGHDVRVKIKWDVTGETF